MRAPIATAAAALSEAMTNGGCHRDPPISDTCSTPPGPRAECNPVSRTCRSTRARESRGHNLLVSPTAGTLSHDRTSSEGGSPDDAMRGLDQSWHYRDDGDRPCASSSAAAGIDSAGQGSPQEGDSVTFVARFGSQPATYCAEDARVRLHVRPGCLRSGQHAGPISTKTTNGCLVECKGCSYLVSTVVDCQPSGTAFDAPLDLDFRIGEELDAEDESPGCTIDTCEYLTSLCDDFKVRRWGCFLPSLSLHLRVEHSRD